MSSLDLLKQELITQKTKLDTKGYPVNCANSNPSPSEITTTITNLPDLTQVTTTKSDVITGKTFIAPTGELQVGTYEPSGGSTKTDKRYYAMVFGVGDRFEIEIPTTSEFYYILPYAFYSSESELPYKQDLDIPSNITTIGSYAFYSCKGLTGTLHISSSCTHIGQRAFNYCENLEHAIVDNGIDSDSLYIFDHCSSLVSVTLPQNIETVPNYLCSYCTKLKSLTIPASTKSILNYIIRNSTAVEEVLFMPATPPTLNSNSFAYSNSTANKFYPYQSYQTYMTTTNYTALTGTKYAHGTFTSGETLPRSTTGYNLTWYATREDLLNSANPITTAPNNQMLFARATAQ